MRAKFGAIIQTRFCNRLSRIESSCMPTLFGLLVLILSCVQPGKLVVLHQVTGPGETNCYLVYDAVTKDAALIDVGGPVDSLIANISKEDLKLKYIFATHMHMDHIEGVPHLQDQFPNALLCYNQQEYEDFHIFREWMSQHSPTLVSEMKSSPEFSKWLEYDLSIFKMPDIHLEGNQTYELGNLRLRTLVTPGHSRGSICFHVGDVLFTGDVLFYRRVGRTDLLGGSKDDIIQSVRKLYAEFPDSTRVYPGHGEFTDVGSERRENEEVTIEAAAVTD